MADDIKPVAYLVTWDDVEPRSRVQMTDKVEPWLEIKSPSVEPLYSAADMQALREDRDYWKTEAEGEAAKVRYRDEKMSNAKVLINELGEALDQHEAKVTGSEDGDLWRWWKHKADEASSKLSAAEARVAQLEAMLQQTVEETSDEFAACFVRAQAAEQRLERYRLDMKDENELRILAAEIDAALHRRIKEAGNE